MSILISKETPIKNLKIIEHQSINDDRGYLNRLFCQNTLNDLLKEKKICQINSTLTLKKGTIRGMHFQYPPYAETKIVSCLKGRVWDVAIDLRKGSSTFLSYQAEILSEDDNKSYFIPEGFAHGFQTLSPNCQMLYFHTSYYKKEYEGAVSPIDPKIKINWPEQISEISGRDSNHPMLSNDFDGIQL
jgi:dTDP-4-dehydrorhamnose 3,5-epimerase